MDKTILVQYADLQEEIKDLRRRIEKIKDRLKKIEKETVIDSVTGTRKDGTFGSIRIEGYPYADYNKRSMKLRLYMAQLEKAEAELLEMTGEVERFINSIEDSHIRQIVRYRVVDGMTWREVAKNIGGRNNEENVKKAFHRFLDKN